MPAEETHSPPSWRGFSTADLPPVAPWVEYLGRTGFYAKGIVYLTIGILAFRVAIGAGGQLAGGQEAIKEIGRQPFGTVLLAMMTTGLMGYALWRWIEAVKDAEGVGNDARGIGKRIAFATSGLVYAGLAIYAGALTVGMRTGGKFGSGATEALTTSIWGRVLLGSAGSIMVAVAVAFIYQAYRARFMTKYPIGSMGLRLRTVALYVGRAGLSTRGIAFAIIGWFLLKAARTGTDSNVTGLSGALAEIAIEPHGKFMLAVAGLGLICYAAHSFLAGTYRHFNVAGR